jgi:hypothetical protein
VWQRPQGKVPADEDLEQPVKPIVREEDAPGRVKVIDPDSEVVRTVRPATLKKGISDGAWSEAVGQIRAAQNHYVAGNHVQAIDQARRALQRVPDSLTAWQIVAASECALKNERGARAAAVHVDARRLGQLRQVCARHGIDLP